MLTATNVGGGLAAPNPKFRRSFAPLVGMEPPPNVMRAEALRKGQLRGKIRTGAKTATKDQERDYLDRFRRLAEDPNPLVPKWLGTGADPFAKLRKHLAKVQARRGSAFWLKWLGRGKRLENAYAHTLLILKGGKIPSFAALKFHGRDIKYILRGNGLRDKLVAVHNHEDPDVRLLGYLDVARKGHAVLVSLTGEFAAIPVGGPLPPALLKSLWSELELDAVASDGGAACRHIREGRRRVSYEVKDLGVQVDLCAACIDDLGGDFVPRLEAYVLAPDARLRVERTVSGLEYAVRPDEARPEFEKLLQAANRDAEEKAKNYEGVTDIDRLTWTLEAFQKRLDSRADGFLLVDQDLWLSDFEAAAQKYGSDDLERQALAHAFRTQPPHVRTSDAGVNKLLEGLWPTEGKAILRHLAASVDGAELDALAQARPTEAFAQLARARKTEERFAGYPKFENLPAPLRLAHDLFKATRTGDTGLFQRRIAEAIRDPQLKPLALALARGFNQSAGIEWQYAPHEKDQALFFEPPAKLLARATPATYAQDLAQLAEALGLPAPTVNTPA